MLYPLICTRCGYEWLSKVEQPLKCAACRSKHWNKPRKYRLTANPDAVPTELRKQKARVRPMPVQPKTTILPLFQSLWRTPAVIVSSYERLTGRTWGQRDDRVGVAYAQVDILLVEIAIATTLWRLCTAKRNPPRSFSYFVPELEQLLEYQRDGKFPATVKEYHQYVLSKLVQARGYVEVPQPFQRKSRKK